MYTKDDITYQLFDLVPSEYYADRFVYEIDVIAETASKAVTSSISYQKSEFLIDAIKKCDAKKIGSPQICGRGSGKLPCSTMTCKRKCSNTW